MSLASLLDLKASHNIKKDDISEEEFSRLRPNINITRLGKLYVLYPKYMKLKRKYQLIQEKKSNYVENKVN